MASAAGSVVVDSLFIAAVIMHRDFIFGPCFVMRAGRFTLIMSFCHVTVSALCLFLAVPLVGLQCVIVALPGHTHLPFCLMLHGFFIALHSVFN